MDNSLTPLSGSAAFQLDRPQAESTYYLRDIVGVLRERWLLFLLALGLVAAPGVWLVMSLQPSYVATSKVIIEPNERMRLNNDSEVTGITLDNESVRSEVEVLTSPDMAQRVVDRLFPRIAEDLEPKKIGVFLILSSLKKQLGMEGTAVEPPLAARFLKRLTVTPVERSRVISVSYRAYDAELAAEVANTIVSEYIDMAVELKRQGTREAAEWLARRMAELQSSIDASERSIEDYRKRAGLIQGNSTPLVAERLNRANLALAQARTRLAEAVARLSQLDTANAADKISEVLKSPVIQSLRGREAELATRVAELSTTVGEGSPHLVTARNSLVRVRLSISEETARIQQNLRKEAESAGALQDGLQKEIESLKRELSELRTASIGLRALEREAEANRAIYENVLLRTKNVAAQESFLRPDARVIGHAVAPLTPASLSPTLLVIACLAGALIASAAVIRVAVHFEPGFSRVRDIERATGISVLSTVPKIRFSRQQFFDDKSFDEFAGSIDMLLGRIMMGRSGRRGIVLTVTSCVPGEGKTTVTMALAHLAARTGYKCLVIDGDFRTLRITRSLGLQASSGLAGVLDHSRKLDEVTTQVSNTALYVLPAGHSTDGIGRLLGSDSFRSIVHGLTQEYDLIIIDSSPLMAAAEPQILAQIADQTLMVVRWKKTPRATIQDATEKLSNTTGVICGIALSQVISGRCDLKTYGNV